MSRSAGRGRNVNRADSLGRRAGDQQRREQTKSAENSHVSTSAQGAGYQDPQYIRNIRRST